MSWMFEARISACLPWGAVCKSLRQEDKQPRFKTRSGAIENALEELKGWGMAGPSEQHAGRGNLKWGRSLVRKETCRGHRDLRSPLRRHCVWQEVGQSWAGEL